MIEQRYGDPLNRFDDCILDITGNRSVFVCHNSPDLNMLRAWLQEDGNRRILIVQSGGPALPRRVWQDDLGADWQRVYWLTKGWNNVDDGVETAKRRSLLAFLASSEERSSDSEVQRLLGSDIPVRRMTLLFGLQCAKEKLERGEQLDANFLSPAATIVREVEALNREFAVLIQAMDSPPANFKEVINAAIKQLESSGS